MPDGLPSNISILLYTCSEDDDDPYDVKYCIELHPLPEASHRSRSKPKREENRDSIDISKTTILSYNFVLKSSMQMLKKTTERIRRKLEEVGARENSASEEDA